MNKKNKLSYILIAAVVLVVVVFLIFSGESTKGYAPDIQEYIDNLNSEGDSSVEMIEKLEAEGALDEETALLYKVYAVFGDPRLPEEYRSTKIGHDASEVAKELVHHFEELSDETKELLAPFMKRPDEEGSWIESRFGGVSGETSFIPKAHANRASTYTEFFTSKDEKVKIWYPHQSGTVNNLYNSGTATVDAETGKKMAKKIKGYLDGDEILDDFEELLGGKQLLSDGTGGGDGKYDIYVAPCGSDLGLTFATQNTPTPSYIIMNYAIGLNRDNVLKTTLAHEVFHAYQYAYDYDDTGDNWWGEATAVWSEDYIYPATNSEHGWLEKFIPHPHTQADKESPPSNHHYGAYIMAYFMTDQFGDDFMRKSWEYCDGKPCLEGIDKNIDGGFKKQWKEFTLWNYNIDPVENYMDVGPFPPYSSINSPNSDDVFIVEGDSEIDIDKLKPLAADLSTAYNAIPDDSKVKKLTFKDLDNFTGKSDKAGIKAVIYYKNGQKEVEDWTKKKKRSFCIENKDEKFDRVVLVFSNGEMKDEVNSAKIKVKSSNTCFEIDEDEDRTAVLHFPVQGGTVDINTTIDAKAEGEPEKDATEAVDYAYQTEWNVWYEFTQVKDAFSVPCDGTTADFEPGWTTRAAGYLKFNLDPKSDGYDQATNTFSIDMHWGEPHPDGNMEDAPGVGINCAGVYVGPSKIDLSGYKGVSEGIYTGTIRNMTTEGAEIEIENCCLYHDCSMQTGAKFQTISEPVILKIKKAGSS